MRTMLNFDFNFKKLKKLTFDSDSYKNHFRTEITYRDIYIYTCGNRIISLCIFSIWYIFSLINQFNFFLLNLIQQKLYKRLLKKIHLKS